MRAVLATLGVLDGAAPAGAATFARRDGDVGTVSGPAVIVGEGRPGPDDPVLRPGVPVGPAQGHGRSHARLAGHVAPGGDGYLMLVGPSVKDVSDDPEGAAVYGESACCSRVT